MVLKQQFLPSFFNEIKKSTANKKVKIVELGCGVGWLSACIALVFPNATVRGLDFSDRALMQASLLKEKNSISNVEFSKFDLVKDSFENLEIYDFIISTGVLHHTGNMEKILGNLHNVSTQRSSLFLGLYHLYKRAPFLQEFTSSEKKNSDSEMFARFKTILPSTFDDVRAHSWFEDQVKHPHETQHTVGEIVNLTTKRWAHVSNSITGQNLPEFNALLKVEKAQELIAKNNFKNNIYDPGFFLMHLKRK